ncbi:MAG: c-type cytochrome [Acidimicrobiales bacterium]
MTTLLSTVLAASTVQSVGAVIAVLTTLGFVWYVVVNIRAGRDEVGSEIELAPNRKPYYDDEGLEGPRLTSALSSGLVLLGIVAIGLPLYWLNEPGRMDGAIDNFDQTFIDRGADLFATTAEGGFNCAGCHGPEGVGGVAPPFTLNDDDNEFVAQVNWQAPAINTALLRFSEEEVREVLVYGRPGSPMPAWGEAGGGPLTSQQIDELIAYMASVQLTPEEAKAEAEEALRADLGLSEGAPIDYTDPAVGEAVFNLGLESGYAGGAYSCARCHTKGASFRDGEILPEDADVADFIDFEDGSGAFGFSLRGGVIPRQFLSIDDLIDFLSSGSEFGILYGQRGVGSGRMPGYGDNPNTEEDPADGMFSQGMIRAVACYEASLGGTPPPAGSGCRSLPADADEAEADDADAPAATTTSTTQEP